MLGKCQLSQLKYPDVQGEVAARAQRAKRSYSTYKVRRGGCEEIPHVQGKRNPGKILGAARGIRGQTHKP